VPIHQTKLDSFFLPEFKVANIKMDVQGNKMKVIKGAKRLLKYNLDRIKVRFETDKNLLKLQGMSSKEIMKYMISLGFKQVVGVGSYDMDIEKA
jgi:hypothetical protein